MSIQTFKHIHSMYMYQTHSFKSLRHICCTSVYLHISMHDSLFTYPVHQIPRTTRRNRSQRVAHTTLWLVQGHTCRPLSYSTTDDVGALSDTSPQTNSLNSSSSSLPFPTEYFPMPVQSTYTLIQGQGA